MLLQKQSQYSAKSKRDDRKINPNPRRDLESRSVPALFFKNPNRGILDPQTQQDRPLVAFVRLFGSHLGRFPRFEFSDRTEFRSNKPLTTKLSLARGVNNAPEAPIGLGGDPGHFQTVTRTEGLISGAT